MALSNISVEQSRETLLRCLHVGCSLKEVSEPQEKGFLPRRNVNVKFRDFSFAVVICCFFSPAVLGIRGQGTAG